MYEESKKIVFLVARAALRTSAARLSAMRSVNKRVIANRERFSKHIFGNGCGQKHCGITLFRN